MKEILFVTTNKGKVESLQHSFDLLNADVVVTQTNLELAEEQADDALKVAQAKAKLAFRELAKPLVVDDSAFHIPVLGGFPGVYQKYVIETIGPVGILKLLEGVQDRSAYFISNLVYVDEEGKQYCFSDSHYNGTVAHEYNPDAAYKWGQIGKIFIPRGATKVATELSADERKKLAREEGFTDAYDEFAYWYTHQQTQ